MAFGGAYKDSPESEQASYIVKHIQNDLLEGMFGMTGKKSAVHLLRHEGIFMADIENECSIFQEQLQHSSQIEHSCLVFPDVDIPVPMKYSGLRNVFFEQKSLRMENTRTLFPRADVKVAFLDTHSAVGGFCHHLQRFLTARLKYFGGNTANPPSSRPMLMFRVDCLHNHGRVHYSPAYFFDPNLVFGAPSTPVLGSIDPGLYLFGVKYLGQPVEFDTAKFAIPPLNYATLQV